MVSDETKRKAAQEVLDDVSDSQIQQEMESKTNEIMGDGEKVQQDLNEEDQVLQKVKEEIEKAAQLAQKGKKEADEAGRQLKSKHAEKGAEIEQKAIKDDVQAEKILDNVMHEIEQAVQDELEEEGLINDEEQAAMELIQETTNMVRNIDQELEGILMNKTYGQISGNDLRKTAEIMEYIKKGMQEQERIIKQMKYTFQELEKIEGEIREIVEVEELIEETTKEEENETQFGENLAQQMGDKKAAKEENQEEQEEKQLEQKEQQIEQMIQKVEQQVSKAKQERKQLIQENQESIQMMEHEAKILEALFEDLRQVTVYLKKHNHPAGKQAEKAFQESGQAKKAANNVVQELNNAF